MNNKRQAGFSILELLVVVAMSLIITAIAVPSYRSTVAYLRAAGDVRALNGLTAQAKMRAAATFTHARVYADLNGNSYQLQVWSKPGTCWVMESDRTNSCLPNGQLSGAALNLSQGDTFGFGTHITAGPTPGQTTMAQAAQCLDNGGSAISNSACIVFNSRGIPIDSTNSPIATGALYLTNGAVVNGVTVSATGSIQAWSTPATSANWHAQ
jgi:prepilin-type N-terminal cleavage/methylation domain-containing protein